MNAVLIFLSRKIQNKKGGQSMFKRVVLFVLLASFVFFAGKARAAGDVERVTTEITYNIDTPVIDIVKIRPFDFTAPSTKRVDVMLGRKLCSFVTIYLYGKTDSRDRSWLGPKLVLKKSCLNGNLDLYLESRYFFGLNERSKDQGHLIPSISHRLAEGKTGETASVGIMGFGIKTFGGHSVFYLGPYCRLDLAKGVSLIPYFGWDVHGRGNFVQLKIGIKF